MGNGNAVTKRYEKTLNGFLMRTYRNMKSRVTGVLKTKAHLYQGLPILSKEDFYSWSKANAQFRELFYFWEQLRYDKLSSPSIDRIDSSKGYTIDNMQWITQYENSANGNKSRYK